MTIDEIRFEMSINDVRESDIDEIIEECMTSGFSMESLDEELQKRGYRKIFSVDYDDMDSYQEEEWDDFE